MSVGVECECECECECGVWSVNEQSNEVLYQFWNIGNWVGILQKQKR